MRSTKRKRERISIERLIGLVATVMAVAGWALLIVVNLPTCGPPENIRPTIQDLKLDRDVVPVGETVSARVIVKDPNLPDDEISYYWEAYFGKIGEQLDRFQDRQVTYVAPDQPGIDFIEVLVHDREGETDKEYRRITIVERGKR